MQTTKLIPIANLLLDLQNYRHGEQPNQNAALNAIIKEQGIKLAAMASDILENGLNPSDLLIVIDAPDVMGNYIVLEGNRRLSVLRLLQNPALCEGTELFKRFVKLSSQQAANAPITPQCVVVESRTAARVWIQRKHASGMKGIGTEQWKSVAKARSDRDGGANLPALTILDSVLNGKKLSPEVQISIENGDFNFSTLDRLVTTFELQQALKFNLPDLDAHLKRQWLLNAFSSLITIIETEMFDGGKFTVRLIDAAQDRADFVSRFVATLPTETPFEKDSPNSGTKDEKDTSHGKGNPGNDRRSDTRDDDDVVPPKPAPDTPNEPKGDKRTPKPGATQPLSAQKALVPRLTKIPIPIGRTNQIFLELKAMDVNKFPNAVAVLYRVFLEFSLVAYLQRQAAPLPKEPNGFIKLSLDGLAKLAIKTMKVNHSLADKDLKPAELLFNNINSPSSANTLNAFVHNSSVSPNPLSLKTSWSDMEPFIQALWKSNIQK